MYTRRFVVQDDALRAKPVHLEDVKKLHRQETVYMVFYRRVSPVN